MRDGQIAAPLPQTGLILERRTVGRRDVISGLGSTGALALAAAPFAAFAQAPGRTYRIAFWHIGGAVADMTADSSVYFHTFFQELLRLGFVERKNLVIDRYGSEGRSEHYAPTARQIVDSNPDVIAVNGNIGAGLLLDLTTSIPIVVSSWGDPLAYKMVASIARPSGNITGFTIDGGLEIYGLRLELLKDVAVGAKRLGFLAANSNSEAIDTVLRATAAKLGVEVVIQVMQRNFNAAGYDDAFAEFARQGVGGILVSSGAEHSLPFNQRLIIARAGAANLPTMFTLREAVDVGALMAFGSNRNDNYTNAARYVARILNGEKPGDLPIQQPTRYDFVINLKTAKTLGIEIPYLVLARATEVIE